MRCKNANRVARASSPECLFTELQALRDVDRYHVTVPSWKADGFSRSISDVLSRDANEQAPLAMINVEVIGLFLGKF